MAEKTGLSQTAIVRIWDCAQRPGGNGYRLAELMGAMNPSGWSGVLKVKNLTGATAGYLLLYSKP